MPRGSPGAVAAYRAGAEQADAPQEAPSLTGPEHGVQQAPLSLLQGSGDMGLETTTLCVIPAFRGASAPSLADIANTAHWGSTIGASVSPLQSWLQ